MGAFVPLRVLSVLSTICFCSPLLSTTCVQTRTEQKPSAARRRSLPPDDENDTWTRSAVDTEAAADVDQKIDNAWTHWTDAARLKETRNPCVYTACSSSRQYMQLFDMP